jgi:predicted NBD/HSP70 family sugar kinase
VRKIDTGNFRRATRSTAREVNRQILLELVREHQPISRADLARQMNLGRGTVTELVNALLTEGEIYEGATALAPRGRRPTLLHIRTRDRFVVGVDVRFSRTSLMLSDFAGRQLALQSFETPLNAPQALVDELQVRVARLLESGAAADTCQGIGVVVPGVVDRRAGRVLAAPQLGWGEFELARELERATGLPVSIENAPMACALAHLWLGANGANTENFVYVTVADGVGVGVVANGQIVRGHGGTAGEFGHIPIEPNGPICRCGSRGCLEACTSNLATLARYLGYDFSDRANHQRLHDSQFTMPDLIARFRSGDARARSALEETARYLGMGLAVLVNGLNPGRIFVGGEIAGAWDLVEPILRQAIASRALTRAAGATPLVPEPATEHPRLRGAMALIVAPVFAAPQVG